MIEPQSVYELAGAARGRRVWVIAPGPSSEPYDEYSERIEDSDDFIIAVNSALEFTTPDVWLWSDKRFGWLYGHEIHNDGTGGPCPMGMACPSHQMRKMRIRYAGERLWQFNYQMKLLPWEELKGNGRVAGKPFWYSPTRYFLPGRASAVNNAISLAWLLEPRVCFLVGVDWRMDGPHYYRHGIERNPGPRPEERERALAAGEKFFKRALKLNLWENLLLVSLSPNLAKLVPTISWERALEW